MTKPLTGVWASPVLHTRNAAAESTIACAISGFAGAMMGALLCAIGPAWAGGGGSDGGVSQVFVQQVCDFIGAKSCPQLPTLTQIILGISDYQNTPPDFVRGPLGNFAG